jgi:glycosyltransferase involved in cell wall biosynthesis
LWAVIESDYPSRPMNDDLVINGRQASSGFAGGVSRYTVELAKQLTGGVTLHPPQRIASGPFGHFWEQAVLPVRARGNILFSPANFGPVKHPKHIVTIHDVSPIDHPEWFAPSYVKLFRAIIPRLARNAAVVATDSEFGRDRISEVLGVEAMVAGVGVGAPFIDAIERQRNHSVVVVGGHDPRKNVDSVVRAWPLVTQEIPDAELIIVGSSRSSWVFSDASEGSGPHDNVTTVSDVDDAELVELLSTAGAAVFCSLYEGFGLPVLEAMATGTPVVCSDIPPLHEFADGVAEFVEPTSIESIAYGIVKTLGGDSTLGAQSRAMAAEHTWSRVAEVVLDVAEQL